MERILNRHAIRPQGILQMGANYGQESRTFSRFCKTGPIVLIEAIPSVFAQLQKNVKPFENQLALLGCLSDKDGETLEFNVSNNGEMSSSVLEFDEHLKAHPDVRMVAKLKLQSVRADTLLRENGIEFPNGSLLVSDCQGYDLVCIKSLGSVLEQFTAAIVEINECSIYKGCALEPEVDAYLAEFGLMPVARFMADGKGWGDKIYSKRKKR